MGSLPEREGRGKGKGRGAGGVTGCVGGGGAMGVAALGRAAGHLLPAGLLCSCKLLREEERREERRKKGRKRKEKIWIFLNLKISKK
jgi:hypothetical protein